MSLFYLITFPFTDWFKTKYSTSKASEASGNKKMKAIRRPDEAAVQLGGGIYLEPKAYSFTRAIKRHPSADACVYRCHVCRKKPTKKVHVKNSPLSTSLSGSVEEIVNKAPPNTIGS